MVPLLTPSGWYLVTQPDHAALAGDLARHWDFARLPGEKDSEFQEAVSRHEGS